MVGMRNDGNSQLDIRTYALEEFIAMHMQKMSPGGKSVPRNQCDEIQRD